jgi:hypothetical protein
MFVKEKANSSEEISFRIQITAIYLEYSGRPPSFRIVFKIPNHYRHFV